ncbi:uncharacterized protein [Atheta coriaria]|uniref:uncharacterized protein n=1 Tax=Dalotia coriaria TaxID=877792 RepID=UPI0031F35B1A
MQTKTKKTSLRKRMKKNSDPQSARFCVLNGKLLRVYEENPFLNGEFQPGINVPQGPVNDPGEYENGNSPPIIEPIHVNHRPTIRPVQPIGPILPPVKPPVQPPVVQPPSLPPSSSNDLYKYCLHPRGTFQSRYCNAFVNCWDGNVVEQFCGATLVFNPKGFCDYIWNVNCNGKPIKEIPVVLGGSNGWPTDGSYVPPTSPPSLPPGPKPTVKPPPIQAVPPVIIDPIRPPYRPNPGGPIYTIEPPGFGNPPQVSTPRPVILPHPTTTTTTTWRPIVTHPTLPPVVTFPTPGNPDLKKYCLHPRGQFAGPHCNKFINCWDDVVIEQDCPYGLNFNPNKHYCDFPYNYPCRIFKDADQFQNEFQGNQLGF